MNALRKKSAVEKYKPLFVENKRTIEELRLDVAADEKNFTAEEVDEIMAAVGDRSADAPESKKDKPKINEPKDKAAAKKDAAKNDKGATYEEWEVNVTNKKNPEEVDKIKKIRAINISDEEAETLNTGVLHGGNGIARMYFKI